MKRDPLAGVPPGEFVARRNVLVKELRAAGKRAEATALAARRGILRGGGVDAMRDAQGALRAALSAAEAELPSLSGAARRRALDTLRAAATADDATRAALRAGRLEADLDPATGFEALGAVRLPARRKPARAVPRRPSAAETREARARERRERRLARLRAEAEAAERRARRLRAKVEEEAAARGA